MNFINWFSPTEIAVGYWNVDTDADSLAILNTATTKVVNFGDDLCRSGRFDLEDSSSGTSSGHLLAYIDQWYVIFSVYLVTASCEQ